MSRKFAAMGAGVLLVLAGLVVHVSAQDEREPEAAKGKREAPPQRSPDDMMRRCMDRMKGMGMPEGMLQACRVRMSALVRNRDPAGLLALKADLTLTAEQIERLTALVEKARAEARSLLTDAQRETLDTLVKRAGASMGPGKMPAEKMKSMGERRSRCCPMPGNGGRAGSDG